jgi:hypothetical protein
MKGNFNVISSIDSAALNVATCIVWDVKCPANVSVVVEMEIVEIVEMVTKYNQQQRKPHKRKKYERKNPWRREKQRENVLGTTTAHHHSVRTRLCGTCRGVTYNSIV